MKKILTEKVFQIALVKMVVLILMCATGFAEATSDELYKLLACNGAPDDLFGHSVGIWGDYAVVGAYTADANGSNSGSACIFKRDPNSSWIKQAELDPNDGDTDDWFGHSVSISGDYAVVGAHGNDDDGNHSGSAYIFKRTGTSWSQKAKLLADDAQASTSFGFSVSISGDTVVVGSVGDDDVVNGEDSGSAYIFKRTGTGWTEEDKLLASDGGPADNFGYSVSISGDSVVVGAYQEGGTIGSAYIYKRTGTEWTEEDKLLASDGEVNDTFGRSVSISGDCAVVGADGDDDTGSAYIFKRDPNSSWFQKAKLLPSDGAPGWIFGYSVSIFNDNAIVGAWGDTENGNYTASAYIVDKPVISQVKSSNGSKPAHSIIIEGQNFEHLRHILDFVELEDKIGKRHRFRGNDAAIIIENNKISIGYIHQEEVVYASFTLKYGLGKIDKKIVVPDNSAGAEKVSGVAEQFKM